MTSDRIAIVLIADQAYTEQLTVTMKSIMYHNKSVDFYIINQGIMTDWFRKVRRVAKILGGAVYSIPFDTEKISCKLGISNHSSLIAYVKYFIADLVDREKVLYIDSDTVINGDLKSIFSIDLSGFPVAAVRDIDGSYNTGVLLIDIAKWRELSISEQCLEICSNKKNEQLELEDFKNSQSIFNQLFQDNCLELAKRYNVQVGYDLVAFYNNWQEHFNLEYNPLVIHYTTNRKPWNSSVSYRFREKWWDFYHLDFQQLLAHHLDDFSFVKDKKQGLDFFTFTTTESFEGIEHLATTFPEHRFHISAYTAVGPYLNSLGQFDNIYLHPECTTATLEELFKGIDAYLNINYGDVDETILRSMEELNKPIFSFYATHKGKVPQYLFLRKEIEKLEDAIRLFSEIGAERFSQAFKQEELFDITVMSIDETLDDLIATDKSLVRFGDGEFSLINGNSIAYQEYQEDLAQEMREILINADKEDNVLVCLPEIFEIFKGNFLQNNDSENFWKNELDYHGRFFQEICQAKKYGSTWISRCYIDNKDKSQATTQFEKIKALFADEDILIVEGATTRAGVGNDLFNNVRSIKRIICPSHHAFSKVDVIQQAILDHAEGRLILLMLGPTAKILAYRLSRLGYRALDLGHIDSEYEWMQMGAETKVQLKHKHTAEFNFDQGIEFIEDENYNNQIVVDLTK
ncbi:SP_1767 family glycosyltransferase [Streptococcus vulneris]|uniref:SP_1767 family glycosyltransferase n=1 Tax=Streptococcus vulneris TaxID=2853160 RepID=A0ABS6SUY3_9STRE|nr:SP_1767 family glycosyltransferase [Streptococcus vulneris]MBV7365558.1 SP_1767 family glycosyltransferase [Streptococcus vulneris]